MAFLSPGAKTHQLKFREKFRVKKLKKENLSRERGSEQRSCSADGGRSAGAISASDKMRFVVFDNAQLRSAVLQQANLDPAAAATVTSDCRSVVALTRRLEDEPRKVRRNLLGWLCWVVGL